MKKTTILFLLLLLYQQLNSQVDLSQFQLNEYISIELKEGTKLVGKITTLTNQYITISTSTMGEIKVNQDDILSIKTEEMKVFTHKDRSSTGYEFDNPFPNKNYITETAIGLKKGQGYYQNILVGGHIVAYGISDNFSLAGGIELFSLFAGQSPVILIAPKYTFGNQNEHLHFAIGANAFLFPDGSGREAAGSIYGVTTLGNTDQNISIGLGFGYSTDEFVETPQIQIGGMFRLASHIMLVSDHLIVSDSHDTEVVGTWTIRYITEKVSIDLGAAVVYSEGAIPIIGASISF